MKKLTLASSVLALFAANVMATDVIPDAPNQMSQVLSDLSNKGYQIVKEVEFDSSNGIYNAKVVNADGKNMNLQVNPKTHEITKSKDDAEGMPALDVAKKVETAGYANIYRINSDMFGDKYSVTVVDKDGKKIDLTVDSKNGNISKD